MIEGHYAIDASFRSILLFYHTHTTFLMLAPHEFNAVVTRNASSSAASVSRPIFMREVENRWRRMIGSLRLRLSLFSDDELYVLYWLCAHDIRWWLILLSRAASPLARYGRASHAYYYYTTMVTRQEHAHKNFNSVVAVAFRRRAIVIFRHSVQAAKSAHEMRITRTFTHTVSHTSRAAGLAAVLCWISDGH